MFDPTFLITPAMLNNLNEIEVIKEKINNCKIHPKEEYRLKRDAVLSMVHNSTAIEGNTLNQFEEGKTVHAPSREIYEVKNYKKALNFISKVKSPNITEKEILKIHKLTTENILPSEKCGKFRKEPVYVVRRTPISQEIIYTAPDHKKVPSLIKDLCRWINKKRKENLSPIIISGIVHAQIAAIHPFADGNGRAARLLATLILYTEKYDFRKLFALDNFYNRDRNSYYKAIHLGKNYTERTKGDMTKWLEYFVDGFLVEMELVLDKIKPFLYLKKASHGRIILSKKEIQILDFLNEMQSIKSKDVEDVLTVSKRTAQRYLLKLVKQGLIEKQGTKKDAYYVVSQG
jgi:Fic family protein